jgi:hypothetical protein
VTKLTLFICCTGGIASCTLNHSTRWWTIFSFTFKPLYSRGKELPHTVNRMLDILQSWAGSFGKKTLHCTCWNSLHNPSVGRSVAELLQLLSYVGFKLKVLGYDTRLAWQFASHFTLNKRHKISPVSYSVRQSVSQSVRQSVGRSVWQPSLHSHCRPTVTARTVAIRRVHQWLARWLGRLRAVTGGSKSCHLTQNTVTVEHCLLQQVSVNLSAVVTLNISTSRCSAVIKLYWVKSESLPLILVLI